MYNENELDLLRESLTKMTQEKDKQHKKTTEALHLIYECLRFLSEELDKTDKTLGRVMEHVDFPIPDSND